MSVSDQGRVFLGMMLCGICIGVVNDLLGLFRRGTLTTAAADLLLGVLSAACIIACGLKMQCDPMRLYALLGAALGFAAYGASVGTIVRKLARGCMRLTKKVKK